MNRKIKEQRNTIRSLVQELSCLYTIDAKIASVQRYHGEEIAEGYRVGLELTNTGILPWPEKVFLHIIFPQNASPQK